MLNDYPITRAPEITRDRFAAILAKAQSPAAPSAGGMYDSLVASQVSPLVFLGVFHRESRYGTVGVCHDFDTKNPGNVRTPESPAAAVVIDTPRGRFAKYADWVTATADWCRRLRGPKYEGAGLVSIRQVLPKYAPSGDQGNSPEAYIAAVLADISAWLTEGVSSMGHVPRPPIDDLIEQTVKNKADGVGFDWMDHDRQPGATVLHSMAGTLGSCINYFPLPTTPALTDYGIGNAQDPRHPGFARIVQFNDIRGRREGWASGPVKVPEGDGPRWLAHIGGAGAVNDVGVSIEHDDTTRADGTVGPIGAAPASAYQWASSVWLQAWLHAEVFGQTSATYDWNMHHREICGHEYKDCPRPRIYDHTEEYQSAVKAIMDYYQRGLPYPGGGLVIAGMKIAAPTGSAPQPPPAPFKHAPGFLDPLVDTFDWQGAGIVTYRKVRAYNDQERKTYEREWFAERGYTPWVEVK